MALNTEKQTQCCGSALVSMRIRIQYLKSKRIQIWIQLLMTKNVIFTCWKKIQNFFYQKLQYIYSLASMNDVQATGEVSSPQNRTSGSLNHEISSLFCWSLLPPESGPDPHSPFGSGSDPVDQNQSGSMGIRIRIHNTGRNHQTPKNLPVIRKTLGNYSKNLWQCIFSGGSSRIRLACHHRVFRTIKLNILHFVVKHKTLFINIMYSSFR